MNLKNHIQSKDHVYFICETFLGGYVHPCMGYSAADADFHIQQLYTIVLCCSDCSIRVF